MLALTLLNTSAKSWYSSGTPVRSIGVSAKAEAKRTKVLPFDNDTEGLGSGQMTSMSTVLTKAISILAWFGVFVDAGVSGS